MWKPQVKLPPSQPATVAEVVKRLVRIESKLHALAKGLNVDLTQLHEPQGNPAPDEWNRA